MRAVPSRTQTGPDGDTLSSSQRTVPMYTTHPSFNSRLALRDAITNAASGNGPEVTYQHADPAKRGSEHHSMLLTVWTGEGAVNCVAINGKLVSVCE